ncbi:MAG: redoxin domain-containing protein [Chloroflexi bacterium]|nr:redoxin domain-containing protein [Chloroflexota bacterium]
MTRATRRQAAPPQPRRDDEAPLFFERGAHPTLRRWVVLSVAVAAVLGAIWLLQEGSDVPFAAQESASVAYDLAGNPISAPLSPGEGPRVGKPAPDFVLLDLEGRPWQLSALRGKAVVLNIWATWCPPCRAEMPELDALYQKYKDQDVLVLGLNLREDASAVSRFAKILNLTFPILLDPQGRAIAQYNIVALPTTFFIDREGVVSDINIGALSDKALEAKLRKAMQ